MATAKKRANKPVKKAVRRRVTKPKSGQDYALTKIDFWAIAAKEVYDAARRAGFTESQALSFSQDRNAHPDWIVDADDPIRKLGWEDGEEDV